MTRAYTVKGRKRKSVADNHHSEQEQRDEDEEEQQQQQIQRKKPTLEKEEPTPTPIVSEENTLAGIPIAPSIDNKTDKQNVIFILEKASLEVAKVGKTYQLLHSDDHANFLRKNNKNPGDYRPDICHQVGAMAHGKIETDYTDDYIGVSAYPLSAAYCISRITNAIEQKWKIL